MRTLPLDLIRDCLDYLSYEDLISCQRAGPSLKALVKECTELRLRIHLGQKGIRAETPGTFTHRPLERRYELQRLSEIEERLSFLQFGEADQQGKIYQFPVRTVDDLHLACVADGDVFVRTTVPDDEGMNAIAKYRLDNRDKEPEILAFLDTIRHWQLDAAEGVLLIVLPIVQNVA